jgi:hypothetical protein
MMFRSISDPAANAFIRDLDDLAELLNNPHYEMCKRASRTFERLDRIVASDEMSNLRRCYIGHANAVAMAADSTSGKLVYNAKSGERDLKKALWNARHLMNDMLKELGL